MIVLLFGFCESPCERWDGMWAFASAVWPPHLSANGASRLLIWHHLLEHAGAIHRARVSRLLVLDLLALLRAPEGPVRSLAKIFRPCTDGVHEARGASVAVWV
jgi:hypothetical protein